jgi:hypothetical protein
MGGYDNLHADNVTHDLRGKNVLVTGGTQGIGSGSPSPPIQPEANVQSPSTLQSWAQT